MRLVGGWLIARRLWSCVAFEGKRMRAPLTGSRQGALMHLG